MECRPPRKRINIVGDVVPPSPMLSTSSTPLSSSSFELNSSLMNIVTKNSLNVEITTNLADHPLVCGPRYNESHISTSLIYNPGYFSSGLVVGLIGNDYTFHAIRLRKLQLPKIYELKGEFGFATDNFRSDGKIRVKSTYKHIRQHHYERILAKIESAQRIQMYKVSGIDMQSEAAFQLASQATSLPPPTRDSVPVVFAIKSIHFEPPNFAIQVQCCNEQEMFLSELINEIGKKRR